MSQIDRPPSPVRWMLRLEGLSGLDDAVAAIEPTIRKTFASGVRGQVLRGDWIGHALHPAMANFVLGSWTSATFLDVIGDQGSRRAAQQLVGAGLLAVGPTAWSGWAQWAEAGPRGQRVGLVHAVANGLAIGFYTASYLLRRRGSGAAGARLGFAGVAAAGVAAYLGGHLSTARKVGTRHPAFVNTGDVD